MILAFTLKVESSDMKGEFPKSGIQNSVSNCLNSYIKFEFFCDIAKNCAVIYRIDDSSRSNPCFALDLPEEAKDFLAERIKGNMPLPLPSFEIGLPMDIWSEEIKDMYQ